MRTTGYTTELSDAQIASILRKRKRRKRVLRRLTLRLGILFIALFMVLFAVFTMIQHFSAKDTLAADSGEDIKGIIFLDPGHGGYETGSVFKNRTEKDDTLALALAIRKELQIQGYRVEMSRTWDTCLSRKKRAKLANRSGAGLMVSIHRNKGVRGQGFGAYIHSDDRKQDRKLAKNIMKELKSTGISVDNGVTAGIPGNHDKDYAENHYSNMPSAMIVFGYINNKKDNELFDQHMEDYAAGVARAIDKTYTRLYLD